MMHFNNSITIGDHVISERSPVFIIAEAGVNHNGDPELAKQLVDIASESGVQAVKFQMFHTEHLILKNTEKAPYQKKTTDFKQSQFEMLKSLEMNEGNFCDLKRYCDEKKILFLCTPFEKNSLDILDSIGVAAYKIAATDLTNIQFLRQIAAKGKPMILSAGMCYLEEIRMALEAIYPLNKDVILMQCTANYPLDDAEVNLNVLDTLRDEFDIILGYSDHSAGVGAAPFAVAKGAKVIEKHFTLSRSMEGPDHRASVEPEELLQLVKDVRRVERYLGSGIKMPTLSEQFTRRALQKYLVAAKSIEQGEPFSDENIVAKRTGGIGISAIHYSDLLGRPAAKHYNTDEIITG